MVISRLLKLARKPVVILLMFALIILGSISVYAVVTKRNPLCFSLAAHGLAAEQLTIANLTRRSESIPRGIVTHIGPSWVTTSGTAFTEIMVEAREFLKGPLPQMIVQLRIQGGTTICGTIMTEGQPSFVEGEEVLLS